MDPLTLIRLSLEIENSINAQGELLPLPGMAPTWLVVARHAGGAEVYLHAGLPAELRQFILRLKPEGGLLEPAVLLPRLRAFAPDVQADTFVGSHFTEVPTSHEYPDVIFDGASFNIYVDGRAVSRAWTQDSSSQANELAVETEPGYRRRGFARQVCSAWAAHVLEAGRVAFYSYRAGNTASAGLARNLGVRWYADMTNYVSAG